jgi:hypothetical protein
MHRKTISILAVAFTASTAACGGAAETTTRGDPTQQPLAAEPSIGSPADDDQGETPAGSTPSPADPRPSSSQGDPSSTPACDEDALNQELSNTAPDAALEAHEHFRCLCDDEGYPLVGNINAKGTKASQFCAAITDKGLL